MKKSLNLLCLGFLICTHLCRLLCDRMKVKHFIQGLGCRNYCEQAGSWSIHHPGGGAEGQLCSRSQPVAGPCGYMARAHGRTPVLPNNLQFWASVKMEGAEFIKAATIRAAWNSSAISPRKGSPEGVRARTPGHQNRPGGRPCGQREFPMNGCHSFPRLVKTSGHRMGPAGVGRLRSHRLTPSALRSETPRPRATKGLGAQAEVAKPKAPDSARGHLTRFKTGLLVLL